MSLTTDLFWFLNHLCNISFHSSPLGTSETLWFLSLFTKTEKNRNLLNKYLNWHPTRWPSCPSRPTRVVSCRKSLGHPELRSRVQNKFSTKTSGRDSTVSQSCRTRLKKIVGISYYVHKFMAEIWLKFTGHNIWQDHFFLIQNALGWKMLVWQP